MILDVEEERVAAAREQAEERRLDRVGLEVERGDVAVQVVDRHERQPQRPRERLRRREPTRSAPISPGPRVTATRSTSPSSAPRLAERLADDRRHELEVPPRRHLGDDPP